MLKINSFWSKTIESITFERSMELFLTEFSDGKSGMAKDVWLSMMSPVEPPQDIHAQHIGLRGRGSFNPAW